jgi:hypothetical protein
MQKIRVIVSLQGGTVTDVMVDPAVPDVELDVVFTEYKKYCNNDKEFFVEGGSLDGECIYCEVESSNSDEITFDAVFKAARERIAHFEQENEHDGNGGTCSEQGGD